MNYNMITCSNCKKQVAYDSLFCNFCGKQLTVGDAVGEGIEKAVVKYAGFWRRVLAGLIDVIVAVSMLLIILVVLVVLLMESGYLLYESPLFWNFFTLVYFWLYQALLESSARQGTVGQIVAKIRITTTEGKRVSFLRSSVRFFSSILSSSLLALGYLMILWDRRNQTLHDKIAKCVFVKR